MRYPIYLLMFLVISTPSLAKIVDQTWGALPGGQPVTLYTLTNARGMEVRIADFGGIIVSIKVPDRHGKLANVVQGFKELAPYTRDSAYYGALIGRYANRIAGAKFTLNGVTYPLVTANGSSVQSHGGPNGYSRRVWGANPKDGRAPSLELNLTDPDGEMGFPGKLEVKVTYTLTSDNRLRIDYRAITDRPTVVNLTNHSYFNLAGQGAGVVDDQELQIFGASFLPADKTGMPLGVISPVAGTDFDFRLPAKLGPRLLSTDVQMTQENGLDHSFVIDGTPGVLRIAGRLRDPRSGRALEIWTTQPGLQVYTANFVGRFARENRGYRPHGAIAFEAQHYPNSPNQPNFPSTEITPGNGLHEVTEFRFLAQR